MAFIGPRIALQFLISVSTNRYNSFMEPTPPAPPPSLQSRRPIDMYISPFFETAQLFLFFFSLISTASAQGLTDAQIELVKQRLQEGATHRSVPARSSPPPRPFRRKHRHYLCCRGDPRLLNFSNMQLLRWLRTFILPTQKVCGTLY